MRIGVLGSGQVGGGIARKLHALGHDVMIGSRSAAEKAAKFPGIKLGTAPEAAAHGEWVVNALPGETSLRVLGQCKVDGKILIDIGNYDIAVDQPIPTPLGEAIQKAHPKMVFPIRRLMRREPEIVLVVWQQYLRAERLVLPRRARFAVKARRGLKRRWRARAVRRGGWGGEA